MILDCEWCVRKTAFPEMYLWYYYGMYFLFPRVYNISTENLVRIEKQPESFFVAFGFSNRCDEEVIV